MQHFNVLSMMSILLICTWSFSIFLQRSRRFSDPGLRSFLGYLTFFNLFTLETFLRFYFQSNVTPPLHPFLGFLTNEMDWLIRSLLILGLFIYEYKLIFWLRAKSLPRWFIPTLLFFLGSLFTLALLFHNSPNTLLKSPYTHFWELFTLPLNLLAVIWLFLLLLESQKCPDPTHRLSNRAFAWFFLAHIGIQGGFALLDFFNLNDLSPILAKILFLYTNLIPIVWLSRFYTPWAGSLGKIIGKGLDMESLQNSYSLSQREVEMLTLIIDGKSYKEIEAILFISIHTVKSHVYNLYRKMGVKSRHQLIHKITLSRQEK